jgi:hypothetical protein
LNDIHSKIECASLLEIAWNETQTSIGFKYDKATNVCELGTIGPFPGDFDDMENDNDINGVYVILNSSLAKSN